MGEADYMREMEIGGKKREGEIKGRGGGGIFNNHSNVNSWTWTEAYRNHGSSFAAARHVGC